jgi:hypothetical protein
LLQQLRQTSAQRREQILKPLKREVRLKRLREGFPATSRFCQLTGLFLPQLHHQTKSWCKQSKVGSPAGLLPKVVTLGFCSGQSTDKIRIQCLLPLEILLKQIQVAGLASDNLRGISTVGAGSPLITGFRDQLRIVLRALACMELASQQSQLLTPPSCTTAWHSGVLIPVERPGYGIHNLGFVKVRAKTIPSRCPGSHWLHRSKKTLTSFQIGAQRPERKCLIDLASSHQPSGQLLIVTCTGIRFPTFSSQSPLEGIDLGCSFRGFNNDVDLSDSDELAP